MQQLTGLDASFLYFETPSAHMHIGSVNIYDQSTAPGGRVKHKDVLKFVADRIHHVPSLTRTLASVPMNLDHPYWVSSGGFDPEFHVRHIALPKPGDWRQFCILIARLHARPLDRSRPLWELYLIEGLDAIDGYPKGAFAIYTKMHHAAVDGSSAADIGSVIHDLSPDGSGLGKPAVIEREIEPTKAELIARAGVNMVRQPFRFVSVARNTVPGFAKAYSRIRKGELRRITEVPRTRFNGQISPHRVFLARSFDLDEVKAIKNAVGTTLNDVALCLVGGALRLYLMDKEELPTESLVALVPINVRDGSEGGAGGNIVSQMSVRVHSEIAEGDKRLEAVHAGTKDAKELSNAIGAKTMMDYSQFIPSTLTAQAARLASNSGIHNQIRPTFNCCITNVPGPKVPLYCAGAQMLTSFGTTPLMENMGLTHSIGSYCGQLMISVTACREMMPDPEVYQQCLIRSFEEMKAAVLKKSRAKNRRSRAKEK